MGIAFQISHMANRIADEDEDINKVVASVSREGKSQVTPTPGADSASKSWRNRMTSMSKSVDFSKFAKRFRLSLNFARRKSRSLLPPQSEEDILSGKKTLVLDLDETLVHTTFQSNGGSDFIIPIKMGKVEYQAYVCKRPGVDKFLQAVTGKFEVVVFTASLRKYADPVIDLLDPSRAIAHRLYRESCVPHAGVFVKDLSLLGRDLSKTIIVDNSPIAYMFQPHNALPCTSWFDDPDDTELTDLIEVLDLVSRYDEVLTVISEIMTHTRQIEGEEASSPKLPPVIETQTTTPLVL
eukprot:c4422_g1_i2.p1 GENE.c4422_g1_i2~~c4422_g1_i2.p1  ORF type:complete len:295 (-),score=35.54 c4422_g1_i2:126-1010(-)